ncbi:hypothetical protein AAG906_028036 [Vitis piasezkii]
MPAMPAPPSSSEPTVTVSLAEFRGLVHSLQTLSTAQDSLFQQIATIRAHQDQILATQAQHTTILHQIQQHLSMRLLLGMIACQLSSPYQRRRPEQSHHMTPLISDIFIFYLLFILDL